MRRRGPTRKERVASATRLLDGLLRSPKSREGLVAAVASHGVSKNFVFGFLAERMRTGVVTPLKAGDTPLYQRTEFVVIEKPAESEYPPWLDPRTIPVATHRHVHIDGRLVQRHEIKGEQLK